MRWSTLEDLLKGEVEIAKRIELEMKDHLGEHLKASGL